jgi:hypothetical protein
VGIISSLLFRRYLPTAHNFAAIYFFARLNLSSKALVWAMSS